MIDGVLQLDLSSNGAAPIGATGAAALIFGPENKLLSPVLRRLVEAEDLADVAGQFNPLVIVGPTGSGKTHIVQGLVRTWSSRLDAGAVAYFTAADFGRDRQVAQAERRLVEWRRSLPSLRLIVIEDIDRLRQRATIQRELRQQIDQLLAAGCVVIVTSQREPMACPDLDAGLRDRLVAGLTVRLQRPERPARREILAQAAAARGIALDAHQLDQLAKPRCATPAQLIGRLAQFVATRPGAAAAFVKDNPESRALPPARSNGEDRHANPRAAVKQIMGVAARYFGVTQAALIGPSRRSSHVQARHVVVHFARRLTDLSYAEIGRALGGRDHSTIMHAENRIAERLAADPAMQHAIDELDRLLGV